MQYRSQVFAGRRFTGTRMALTLILLSSVFGSVPSNAQYNSPGTIATTDAIYEESSFETSIRDAEWQVGGLRLRPWLGVRDASFVTNSNTATDPQGALEDDDFTLTVGAGLRGYLPTGKLIWTAHALPEYVWWESNEDKRGVNGRFGLGVFGYFNRLRFEISQRRLEQQDFFSSEIQELTSQRSDTSRASIEIDVARRLELFAYGELTEIENEEEESDVFSLLDREEEKLTIGLRYLSPRGFEVGAAFEDSSDDFSAGARQLSNSGTSELVFLGYEGPQFSVRLNLEFRSLEGENGSEFGTFDETTGSFEALWAPSARTTLLAYSRRERGFSVRFENAFQLAERQGLRFNFDLGKAVLGFGAAVGEDEFSAIETNVVDRIDDVVDLNADVRFEVANLVEVALRVRFTDYDSNLAAFDRDVTTFGASVQLGPLINKLKLGEPSGNW
ncbi:MAG: hypothetical protein AAF560_10490 [Acidobacteriota bacterium]